MILHIVTLSSRHLVTLTPCHLVTNRDRLLISNNLIDLKTRGNKMDVGPLELILILVIVTMLFGVGRLPEVFGSVGKGIRAFRREMDDADETKPEKPVDAAPVENPHHSES